MTARRSKRSPFAVLGPGLVTGAADDDPSGIGTYSQVGAQFGYGLAWGLMQLMRSENIDFPIVISPATYGMAAVCVLAAGLASRASSRNARNPTR